jgi:hypothetical protein
VYHCQLCDKTSEEGEPLNKLYHYRITEDVQTHKLRPEIASELKVCTGCFGENEDRAQFTKPDPPYILP